MEPVRDRNLPRVHPAESGAGGSHAAATKDESDTLSGWCLQQGFTPLLSFTSGEIWAGSQAGRIVQLARSAVYPARRGFPSPFSPLHPNLFSSCPLHLAAAPWHVLCFPPSNNLVP